MARVRTGPTKRGITYLLTFTACVGFWLSAQPASALQVGAISSDSGYAYFARAQLSEPATFVHGSDDRAYYIATTFPDGWFFQAGYNDAANDYANGTYSDYCTSGFTYFVTGLLGSDFAGPNLYNTGYCNLINSRYFTIHSVIDEDAVHWQFFMSGDPGAYIGPQLVLPSDQTRFLKTNTGVTSELVSSPDPANALFPIEHFNSVVQFVDTAGGGTWVDGAHAHFYASSDRTCYWSLKVLATEEVETGSSGAIDQSHCYSSGDALW